MKGSTLAIVIVALVVLWYVSSSSPSSSSSSRPQLAPPPSDTSFDSAVRASVATAAPQAGGRPGPSAVDRCHQVFVAGAGAVSTKYGAPSSTAEYGAKVNPFYWYCDAGGAVLNVGKKAVNWVGSLF